MAFLAAFLPEIIAGASALVATSGAFVIAVISNKENRKRLEEEIKKLKEDLAQKLDSDTRDVEKLLQIKIAELKNLKAQEKENELKALTETFLRFCEIYANDPETLTEETKIFKRKIMVLLMELKNSMPTGDKFAPRLKVWGKGAMLVMNMFGFLSHEGAVRQSAFQVASQQYRRDVSSMVMTFNASNALPWNAEEIIAIENSFDVQLQEVESNWSRAFRVSSSPHRSIEAPAATSGDIHSPSETEIQTQGLILLNGGGVTDSKPHLTHVSRSCLQTHPTICSLSPKVPRSLSAEGTHRFHCFTKSSSALPGSPPPSYIHLNETAKSGKVRQGRAMQHSSILFHAADVLHSPVTFTTGTVTVTGVQM